MTNSHARPPDTRPRRLRLLSLGILVGLLAVIPLMLAAAAMAPRELVSVLGIESAIAAWLLGAAAAVGVLLMPILTRMGRVGVA